MTLKKQLEQISESGFSRMPQHIAQVLLEGIEEIAASDLKRNALNVGDTIEDVQLTDISGVQKHLSAVFDNDFLILNFYRGGWCPYCNMELRAYEHLKKDFEELGANIVAISAEKPDKANATAEKNTLSFPVFSDENAVFMKSLGIVFALNDSLKKEYTNFGIDLKQIHGNSYNELPVPGVYVINRNFEIVFRHLEEDYMTRFEPSDFLSFFEEYLLVKK